MKRVRTLSVVFLLALALIVPLAMAKPGGFNYKARIFVGTGEQWYMQKFNATQEQAEAYLGIYTHDKLVMKWSKGWDDAIFGPDGIRGNGDELPWGPDAWETNEWNGMFPGGSGETWHYKIIWVGAELEQSDYWRDGGLPIWGQFEVIMSHGTVGGEHIWEAHAIPNGFGGP